VVNDVDLLCQIHVQFSNTCTVILSNTHTVLSVHFFFGRVAD
jgi:hypothetical protein